MPRSATMSTRTADREQARADAGARRRRRYADYVAGLNTSQQQNNEQQDYAEWTVEELRAELGDRGLPKTGAKAELVDRLQQDDRS